MITVKEQVNKGQSNGFISKFNIGPHTLPSNVGFLTINSDGIQYINAQNQSLVENDSQITTIPDEYRNKLSEFVGVITDDINTLVNFFNKINQEFDITKQEQLEFDEIKVWLYTEEKCYILTTENSFQVIGTHENTTKRNYTFYSVQKINVVNDIFQELEFKLKYYGVLLDDSLYILKIVEVKYLFLREKFRRRGVGTLLFDMLKNQLQVSGIIVHSPLLTAQDFYAQQGILFLVTSITPEVYNYIKEYLNFKLKSVRDMFPQLGKIEEMFGFSIVERISDCMILDSSDKRNIKGYYIDVYINNVRIYVNCGIWFDNTKLKFLVEMLTKELQKNTEISTVSTSNNQRLTPRMNTIEKRGG